MQVRHPRLGYGFGALSLAGALIQIPLAAFHVSHRVAYIVLGLTVVLVGLAGVVLWPLVREHSPIRWVGFSPALNPTGVATPVEAPLAPTPLAAALLAAGLDPSDERTYRDRQEEVLRADLVLLTDELAAASNTILTAINDGPYWKQDIRVDVWRAVKDKHAGVKGFHVPRTSVRDAYEAIASAESLRMNHEIDREISPRFGVLMRGHDRDELLELLNRIVVAENSLRDFLDNLAVPQRP